MIVGIQSLIYFKLVYQDGSHLPWPLFICLTLITILLAAGGYVINDYYDRDIDKINKPHRLIAGQLWSLKKVKTIYAILVGSGFILSCWLGWRIGLLNHLFIYPIAVLGLWYYSYGLKCKPIIGNVWVSLFCAGVVIIVVLPDIIFDGTQHIRKELWFFLAFAFLTTWYREVVKDIEDREGDQKSNCQTAVVQFGEKAGKIMAIILGLLLVVALLMWDSGQTNGWVKLGLNVLQGFTVASMAFIWWAKNYTYYGHASNVIKLVMVGGTLLIFFM